MHISSALVFITTYRNRKEQRYAGMKRVDQSTCCGYAKTQGCCKESGSGVLSTCPAL